MKKWLYILIVSTSFVWENDVVAGSREDTFLKELQAELQKKGNPWIAGKTSVSHLPLEVKKKMIGELPSMGNDEAVIRDPLNPPPGSWDWRNKDGQCWMTRVKQQYPCGTCWAFASIAVLEARWNIWNDKPHNDLDLSEAFVIGCNPYGYDCSGGKGTIWNWVKERNKGIPEEDCFEYRGHSWHSNCNNRCTDWQVMSIPYGITRWGTGSASAVDSIKNELMRGPIYVVIVVKEDFFYYIGGIYEPIIGEDLGYHAVCCVGWSDDGGWIIKNSAGIEWGGI